MDNQQTTLQTPKEQAPMALKVDLKDRLMWSLKEAAYMCGVASCTFKKWEREGLMPGPVQGTQRYAAFAVKNALICLTSCSDDKKSAYDEWRAAQS